MVTKNSTITLTEYEEIYSRVFPEAVFVIKKKKTKQGKLQMYNIKGIT